MKISARCMRLASLLLLLCFIIIWLSFVLYLPNISLSVRSILYNKNVFWRCKESNMFALSFDDGPIMDEDLFHKGIDEFRKRKIPATFYMIGKHCKKRPKLVRLLDQDPLFMIASHTQNHNDLAALNTAIDVIQDVFGGIESLKNITGKRYRHMRPPYLSLDRFGILENSNLSVDLYSLSAGDWKLHEIYNGHKLRRNIMNNLGWKFMFGTRHGYIYLGHISVPIWKEIGHILDDLQTAIGPKARFVRMDQCTGFPETY